MGCCISPPRLWLSTRSDAQICSGTTPCAAPGPCWQRRGRWECRRWCSLRAQPPTASRTSARSPTRSLLASNVRVREPLGWTPRLDLHRLVADAWTFLRDGTASPGRSRTILEPGEGPISSVRSTKEPPAPGSCCSTTAVTRSASISSSTGRSCREPAGLRTAPSSSGRAPAPGSGRPLMERNR